MSLIFLVLSAVPALATDESSAPTAERANPVSVIIDLEWRNFYVAEHLSHGPGFGIAFGFFRDHLRVGVHGFARPGPWNPATFTLSAESPVDGALGEPYNGSTELHLRSDGGLVGPTVQIGAELSETFRLDLGATVGFGGFGFYLVGDDRETPDGERTSVWENRLMDGRDSSLGLGMEIGPRLTWAASEHVRPYVAVRYQTIFGYDAFMKPDYDGISVGIGISAGRF